MFLPLFSAEVKCGAAALDIADRQNAHTQSVNLRGLYTLFRLAGKEKKLHRQINSFSISHSDRNVRIWGHYVVINGDDVKYYCQSIRDFSFTDSKGKERWTAYTFLRNIYDLWLPEQFQRICKIIDLLPADLDFDVSEQGPESASSRSGLSQPLENHDLTDDEVVPDSQSSRQPSVQSRTPDTTIRAASTESKKKRILKYQLLTQRSSPHLSCARPMKSTHLSVTSLVWARKRTAADSKKREGGRSTGIDGGDSSNNAAENRAAAVEHNIGLGDIGSVAPSRQQPCVYRLIWYSKKTAPTKRSR